MNPIDYGLIAKALDYYRAAGFKYVEVPWIVSREAIEVTLPAGRQPHMIDLHPGRGLVGSAEQSFLQLMFDGQLPEGLYVAASPCFRDDPVDTWHQPSFFKVELIRVGFMRLSAEELLAWALRFFVNNGAPGAKIKQTSEGHDIELDGVELGSYGVRRYRQHVWTYGTGIAEPRFSTALKSAGASAQKEP